MLHSLIKEIVYFKDPNKIKISYHNLPEIETPPVKPKQGNSGGASNLRFDRRLYWLPLMVEYRNWLWTEEPKIINILAKELIAV